ncbi:MAG: thermosome subunit beta [Candidatus Bathyarchaeia archaeon]
MKKSIDPVYAIFGSRLVFRSRGKQAIKDNIKVAKFIAEMVRTSLGPKGMKKLVITKTGEIVATTDGATLLKKMDFSLIFDHPITNIFVEAAKSQERNVGDGTIATVLLAGELAWKAGGLIDAGLNPYTIIDGYKLALDVALRKLKSISQPINVTDYYVMRNLAVTSMSSKDLVLASSTFPDIITRAVLNVLETRADGSYSVDIDDVKILTAVGGSISDSEFVNGVVVDEKPVHELMPRRVQNAKIALINEPLELRRRKDQHTFLTSANIIIHDSLLIKSFMEEKAEIILEKIRKLRKVGANVVITPKHIDDVAAYYLSNEGILAVRRARITDMRLLMKVTGGRIVTSLNDLSESDLGYADLVEERKIGDKKWVFVHCQGRKGAASIIIRGGSREQLNDIEQAVTNAIRTLSSAVSNPYIVPGGGATEMALATEIKHEMLKYSSKIQLAMIAFSACLERVAMTLAENAGLDPIEVLTTLRSKHETGEHQFGIDVVSGKVGDMFEQGIIEPYSVKEHMLKTAYQATSLLLRIGEVITGPGRGEKTKKR